MIESDSTDVKAHVASELAGIKKIWTGLKRLLLL